MDPQSKEIVIVEGWRGAVRVPIAPEKPAHPLIPERVLAGSRRLTERSAPVFEVHTAVYERVAS